MIDFKLLQNEDMTSYSLRSELFDKLVNYFPSEMAQPSGTDSKQKKVSLFKFQLLAGDLSDLIPIETQTRTQIM